MRPLPADHRLAQIALTLLACGCLWVLWPFLSAILWAAILALISWPALAGLDRLCRGRRILSASIMTLGLSVLVVAPVIAVTLGLAGNVTELRDMVLGLLSNGLPDPPQWLRDLPLVGNVLYQYWQQFSHDGGRVMSEIMRFSDSLQRYALVGGQVLGRGALEIALSVFLAFFFFLHGEGLAKRIGIAAERLAGTRAAYLIEIARGTVSGVIYGILGTALAQGILAAIGFLIAGVPAVLLLGVATFFLSIVPVGPPLVWGGAAFWLFQQGSPGWAVFVAAWGFFVVSMVDNLIKPLIISRGSSLPFAIVLLGVLGGALAFGVIGVFLGPTLLAVGYRLCMEWTSTEEGPSAFSG